MSAKEWLPLAVLASSLLPGLVIFALPEDRVATRTSLNLLGALAKLVLVFLLLDCWRYWEHRLFHEVPLL